MKIEHLQIAKLSFRAGDVAVVKIKRLLTGADAEHARSYVAARLPKDVEVLVLDADADLSVLEQSQPPQKPQKRA